MEGIPLSVKPSMLKPNPNNKNNKTHANQRQQASVPKDSDDPDLNFQSSLHIRTIQASLRMSLDTWVVMLMMTVMMRLMTTMMLTMAPTNMVLSTCHCVNPKP